MTKDLASKTQDAANVLKDVKDEASAKAAVPKINSIADELAKLNEELNKLSDAKTPEEAMKQLGGMMKNMEAGAAASKALGEQMVRIQADPKLNAILGDAMKKLQKF